MVTDWPIHSRFGFVSGDDSAEPRNIQNGLMPSWRHGEPCSASATHQPSMVRIYPSTAGAACAFEAQSDSPFTFDGDPPRAGILAQVDERLGGSRIKRDGVVDFGLPVDDGEVAENGTMLAPCSRSGLAGPTEPTSKGYRPTVTTWPNYTSDATFEPDFARLGSWRGTRKTCPARVVLRQLASLPGRIPAPKAGSRSEREGRRCTVWRRSRMVWGSGMPLGLSAGPRPDPDAVATLPAAKITASPADAADPPFANSRRAQYEESTPTATASTPVAHWTAAGFRRGRAARPEIQVARNTRSPTTIPSEAFRNEVCPRIIKFAHHRLESKHPEPSRNHVGLCFYSKHRWKVDA